MGKSRLPRTPAEIEAFLKALPPGVEYTVSHAGKIETVVSAALTVASVTEPVKEKPVKRKPSEMVCPICVVDDAGVLRMTLPVETKSETNMRDWRARSRRSGQAWQVTRSTVNIRMLAAFEEHYRAGGVIQAVFTRLGGKRLDSMSNLGASMKGVEDAVAFLVGANDGSDQWQVTAAQEVYSVELGHTQIGVRVELRCIPKE